MQALGGSVYSPRQSTTAKEQMQEFRNLMPVYDKQEATGRTMDKRRRRKK